MPPKAKPATRSSKSKAMNDSSSSSSSDDANVITVDSGSDSATDSDTHAEPVRKNTKRGPGPVKKDVSSDSKKSKSVEKKVSGKSKKNESDEEEEVYADDRNDGHQRPKNNSILNFRYEDYLDLDSPINTLDLVEILRYCTSVASKKGQRALMSTLRQTLQAINSERSFPDFNQAPRSQPFGGGNNRFDQSYGNRQPVRRPTSDRADREYRNFD